MDSFSGSWLSPLYYVASRVAWRHHPRDLGRSVGWETLCSRKVRHSCSGLEWCASTEAAQHPWQRCKTLSPERNVGLQYPKPSLTFRWSLVCQVRMSPLVAGESTTEKDGSLMSLVPHRMQDVKPLEDCKCSICSLRPIFLGKQ